MVADALDGMGATAVALNATMDVSFFACLFARDVIEQIKHVLAALGIIFVVAERYLALSFFVSSGLAQSLQSILGSHVFGGAISMHRNLYWAFYRGLEGTPFLTQMEFSLIEGLYNLIDNLLSNPKYLETPCYDVGIISYDVAFGEFFAEEVLRENAMDVQPKTVLLIW